MLSHLSQFQLNALLVLGVMLFHAVGVWSLATLRRRGGGGTSRGRVWRWAAPGILLLDFPIIYLQLFYKSFHPLIVDRILSLIWIPWGIVLLNVSVLCAAAIFYHVSIFSFRLLKRAKKEMRGEEEKPPIRVDLVAEAGPMTVTDTTMTMKTIDTHKDPEGNAPETGDDSPLYHRRRFIQTGAFALGGLFLNASVLAAANGREENTVDRIVVRIPNLPEGLKGTTIAMISDIHSSLFMTRDNMEHYARILKSLKADLIVLPGDFVNSKTREVYPFAEAFSGLHAPLGVYGVTGNHDYYTREIDVVAREVEQAGIRVLRNENLRIEKNGVGFRLLGIDDDAIYDVRDYLREGKTEKGRIENLVKGIGPKEPTIFLCHKPYPFEEYAQLGIDLMLSGHTHGGQIVLGKLDRLNVSVASLASTYIAGLYKARSNPSAQMYVSRGVGTVGLPVRINCPPEVTHVTLT